MMRDWTKPNTLKLRQLNQVLLEENHRMFNKTWAEEEHPEEEIAERPDLCHKCGRCCRSATTAYTHEEIEQMFAEGKQEAVEFLSIFEPFPSLEEAKKVVPEQVEQVLEVLSHKEGFDPDKVTFYHCRYVTEEGLCGIYERRPRCCIDAPYNGWAVMPPGCGFEGWQFLQREKQRSDIRKLKEVQFQMEILSPDGVHVPSGQMTLEDVRNSVSETIKPWLGFGAEHW